MENICELEEYANRYCRESEYKIVFVQDEGVIHEEYVDYEEIYEVLRRYNCMRDTLEILTANIEGDYENE